MKLKHIFDDGQVTYYEVGEILRKVVKAIDELPNSIIENVSQDEKDATEHLEESIVRINNKVVGLLGFLSYQQDEVYRVSEQYFSKAEDARRKLNDKLSRLPDMRDLYIPTHQMTELLDIAERCDRLSDAQWSRVIELAKALSQRSP